METATTTPQSLNRPSVAHASNAMKPAIGLRWRPECEEHISPAKRTQPDRDRSQRPAGEKQFG